MGPKKWLSNFMGLAISIFLADMCLLCPQFYFQEAVFKSQLLAKMTEEMYKAFFL